MNDTGLQSALNQLPPLPPTTPTLPATPPIPPTPIIPTPTVLPEEPQITKPANSVKKDFKKYGVKIVAGVFMFMILGGGTWYGYKAMQQKQTIQPRAAEVDCPADTSPYYMLVYTRDGGIQYQTANNTLNLVIMANRNGGTYNGKTPETQYLYHVPYTIPRDQWVYYAFVASSNNTGKLYINGSEISVGTRITDGGVTGKYQSAIGALKLGTNALQWAWRGAIDEVRISNVARTAAEISANYSSIATTPLSSDANTLGLWHMDEASGDVTDSSSHANTGTTTGTMVVPGILQSARHIDGTAGSGISLSSEISGNQNFTLEGWAKLDSTCLPSPSPSASPASTFTCVDLTSNTVEPKLNDTVTFTCQANFSSVTAPVAFFRYSSDNGTTWSTPAPTAGAAINMTTGLATHDITVNQVGNWVIQCQVCTTSTGGTCTTWGQAN